MLGLVWPVQLGALVEEPNPLLVGWLEVLVLVEFGWLEALPMVPYN